VTDRIRRNPDYLDGFAVGVELLRSIAVTDCGSLLDASFTSFEKRPSSSDRAGAADKEAWDKGCADGQRLAFALHLLHHLPRCFVPVP
jgi:hypothetical protein